jgi:hypothetical protein
MFAIGRKVHFKETVFVIFKEADKHRKDVKMFGINPDNRVVTSWREDTIEFTGLCCRASPSATSLKMVCALAACR